ncbi:50S ribosomal protein L15 [archaeon HR01]|nr:50S ribosomal protein L15 [archaeon HR01]
MPTRLRKVRKLRGSRTHGWGQIGQHRKSGAKGGHGMAGGHKHKWTKLVKTDYFGEKGFYNINTRHLNTMNLDQLSEYIYRTGEKEVDLSRMGVDKLLGKGRIDQPVKVSVASWSRHAEEKIRAAGGEILKAEPT